MKDYIEKTRELLPESVVKQFDDIVEQRILGASKHIAMIGEMIEAIAVEGKKENRATALVINNIKTVAKFFISTRGEASQAISNAILLMIHEIENNAEASIDEAVAHILETKNSYVKISNENMNKVVKYAVELAKDMNTLFVYDFSSTVEKFLTGISGQGKTYTVYIAESRIIDGGFPFIQSCQKAGHNIKFIPDCSLMYYLKQCDAAFMGAETFFPDGTGFNTTGSDIVGLACSYYKIPLYFLTPLIKLDIRPIYGYKKALVIDDMKEKLTKNWNLEIATEDIDFRTPELVGVSPDHITGFVTEKGMIPANQMYGISLEYSKYLKGEVE